MTEFSNLLRQRLSGGPKPGVRPDLHPDADTLTAYVERLLPAAERNQVLEHLAACAHCREVTALALPGSAEDQRVAAAAVPARRWGFLWTPGFIRATVSLAAVVLVAGVFFQFRERPADRAKTGGFVAPASGGSTAEKDKHATQPASEVARLEGSAQPSANAGGGRGPSSLNDVLRADRSESAPADNRAVPSGATARNFAVTRASEPAVMARAAIPPRRDYVNSEFFTNNMSPEGTGGAVATSVPVGELPPAPSPRTSNKFPPTTMNAANIMAFADMPTQNTGTQTVKTIAPPSGSSHWGLTTLTALGPKAKKALAKSVSPPIPVNGLSFSAMGGAGQLNPRTQPSEAAARAPMLDRAVSGLEESGAFRRRALADAGVNAKAEMGESAPSPWRISGGRLTRPGEAGSWVEACQGAAAAEFTAFTANGNELWAGGANAALLHSRDGGATCERITLGASAIGTIVRIDAIGAVVQVRSSSGQSWSSQDGGRTWKMDE